MSPCALTIRNLSVTLGGNTIIEDISFDIRCREVTAILGPNGAGKTTLVKAITGMVPYSGKVHFCSAQKHGGDRPVIGYIPQRLDFDRAAPLSVLEFFAMNNSRRPVFTGVSRTIRQKAVECLSMVSAENLLNKRLGRLSGGEMQRVLFATAIFPRPNLLIMDEPIAGVDASGEALMYELINNMRGRDELSVVIISHDLSMVNLYTDHVVCINRRLICEGTVGDIMTPENIKATFGSYVAYYHHAHSHGDTGGSGE